MFRNVTEILVEQKLASLWKNYNGCKCARCYDDIMSYALNRLSAQYVSTSKGELFNKATCLSVEHEVEITKVLTLAITLVETQPRHLVKQPNEG